MSSDEALTEAVRPSPPQERQFSTLSARSATLVWGVCLALLVESVALEALLSARHPSLGGVLIAVSVLSALWLIDDYRIVARRPVVVGPHTLVLQRGRLMRIVVPLGGIARITEPAWTEVPASQAGDYLSFAGPSGPNVLIQLATPVTLILPAGFRRCARYIGLRVDEPHAFVLAVEEGRSAYSSGSMPVE